MLTDYILIQVNGKPLNCFPNMSLKDLLVYLDCELNSIVVEYNHMIVQNSIFDQIVINPGDIVEILTIVGGG